MRSFDAHSVVCVPQVHAKLSPRPPPGLQKTTSFHGINSPKSCLWPALASSAVLALCFFAVPIEPWWTIGAVPLLAGRSAKLTVLGPHPETGTGYVGRRKKRRHNTLRAAQCSFQKHCNNPGTTLPGSHAKIAPLLRSGGVLERIEIATARGKERVPPGQYLVGDRWPILTYGPTPEFDPENWDFTISGLVDNLLRFTWDEWNELPTVEVEADMHCVTSWSKLDNVWRGVKARYLLEMAGPKPEAAFLLRVLRWRVYDQRAGRGAIRRGCGIRHASQRRASSKKVTGRRCGS